ncbi:hypothetical protein DV515_00004774 [Chloebia gouldiae]|uniref:Amidase domain-containing protein n=1 Tax=Chloebia gouldiae TaxID=44316 RepID=A0A3L8SRX4_CHLGU|nr:hypothetical protein DV515_00004774 [Chloebia gouldiae]
MDEARRSWHLALERMEKAACRLKQENPGTQTLQILSLTMVELEEKLEEESPEIVLYSCMDKAFICLAALSCSGEALEVNQEVNCVTDFIHGCEDQLQKLKKQKEKGLLYGIPISLKDHINCKGHISSEGMVKFLGQVKEEDSIIVQALKHHGGIPFVKTNIPQTMMNYDCSNLIFGQTLNPLNPQKSPGGSSGGEAALMAGEAPSWARARMWLAASACPPASAASAASNPQATGPGTSQLLSSSSTHCGGCKVSPTAHQTVVVPVVSSRVKLALNLLC